jgi:hypothetical protein
MAEDRRELVPQGPGLEKVGYYSDRGAGHYADHAHSYAPRHDTRSQAA